MRTVTLRRFDIPNSFILIHHSYHTAPRGHLCLVIMIRRRHRVANINNSMNIPRYEVLQILQVQSLANWLVFSMLLMLLPMWRRLRLRRMLPPLLLPTDRGCRGVLLEPDKLLCGASLVPVLSTWALGRRVDGHPARATTWAACRGVLG